MIIEPWRGEVGIYYHVPFCRVVCSYCDFLKSSAFSRFEQEKYLHVLALHTRFWLEQSPWADEIKQNKISMLNFGGGTPGIFDGEYKEIFAQLLPNMNEDAEISLEVNPNDINQGSLKKWRDLGFNRLSIGVQTFSKNGLQILGRDHQAEEATRALELAAKEFTNINVDLIYSWPGQSMADLTQDLKVLLGYDIKHLSLYNLSYEKYTPLGQALLKNRIKKKTDDEQREMYDVIREVLSDNGYKHEEISNWAKPGYTCRHNWLYWQGGNYVGIGAGAHGYLPDRELIGIRYVYPQRVSRVLKSQDIQQDKGKDFASDLRELGIEIEKRDQDSWLAEYVGCGLRCEKGIDLKMAEQVSGKTFEPTPVVEKALREKIIDISPDRRLFLNEDEWFRETAWSLEVLMGFKTLKKWTPD